jgi:hypothetical protein
VPTSSFPSPNVRLGSLKQVFHAALNLADPLLAYLLSDDGSLKEDNPLARWSSLLRKALVTSGRVTPTEKLLRERLENAGYIDVKSFTLRLPMGPWAKDKYEPYTHRKDSTYSPRCLTRNLKKLGMMMLLLAETGFQSYGTYAAERKPRIEVADCFMIRTSCVYQTVGNGSQGGGTDLPRCCNCDEEQKPTFLLPPVSY